MNFTIQITPLKDQSGNLKANASIVLENQFKVTGIRIGISKEGRYFVSMPDYKTSRLDENGREIYQDIAYPVTQAFRQQLYEAILEAYKKN